VASGPAGDEYHSKPKLAALASRIRAMEAGMAKTSKIDQYRAGAARCELRAKKARNQDDREWQLRLARGYRALAEAEAERSTVLESAKAAA